MRLGHWVGLLALVIALIILWQLRGIVLLILSAVIFAAALNRVVSWLQGRGIKRGIATVLTVLGVLAILAGFGAIIVPAFIDQFQQFTELVPIALNQLQNWLDWMQNSLPGELLDIRNLTGLIPRLQVFVADLFGNLYKLFSNVLSLALSILFVFVLTVMLVVNPHPYRRGFVLLFPAFYRQRVHEILDHCEAAIVGWMTATLINMSAIAIVSYLGLLILGVPLALVNALLAGLLEFIPNVGPALSIIPPALVALIDSPWKSVAVVIFYFLVQQFEAYILVPLVMRQQVSLLPAVTLASVVIFGAFFGFLGVFLAVPLVILSRIWLQELLIKDVLNHWQRPSRNHYLPETYLRDDNPSNTG